MESTKQSSNEAECGNKSKPLLQAVFLAPYLPFKLQGHYLLSDVVNTPKDELRDKLLTIDNFDFFLKYATPKLKPISDLTIEFINNDVVLREFQPEFIISNRYEWSYAFVQRLFELHIDYFGLIEKGLAVSIHSVV